MFETPVVHFLNRAFLSEGIDEFLAHLTAIEAALGLESDYGKGPAAATRPRKDVRGASRMAARVSALLGSAVNGAIYSNLFDLRSAFVHGRPMGPISTADRVQARSLARRVTNALVEATLQQPAPTAREHFANELLDRGLKMKP